MNGHRGHLVPMAWPRLRLMTWNCRSGSVRECVSELARFEPDLVFLQECGAPDAEAKPSVVCSHTLNGRKHVALVVGPPFLVASTSSTLAGRAAVAAKVIAPIGFRVIGIWAQGPHYVDDVLRTLRAEEPAIRIQPTVVLGDLNSGTRLGRRASLTRHHGRLLDACADLGLVSAYHAFHGVEAGGETHATYFHQFKRQRPWHIDFCFVPRPWASGVINVAIIDGRYWARRSDHRPLLVELDMERVRKNTAALMTFRST